MTAPLRFAGLAVVVALTFGVAAWFLFSSPSAQTPTTPDKDVERETTDATPQPATVRRTRGADAAPAVEAPPPADDPARWPIRVTTNVPGATVTMQVRLYGGDPDPAPETKTTDAKGFVGFAAPAKDVPVHRVELVARADGYADAFEYGPESADGSGDVRISLGPAAAVRGVVRDSAGRPIADVGPDVVETVGVDPPIVCLSHTGKDGVFRWFAMNTGRATLRFSHPAYLGRELTTEVPATDLVVVLDRGLEVSGRVAFPSALPAPGVSITDAGGSWRATTDADGRYVVSGLARGPVDLKCILVAEKRTVEAGATNVDFVVKRSVARIRFLDAQRRPFRFAGTSVRVMKGDEVLEMSAGEGPADGVDLMDGPAGARVLVSARAPDGRVGSGSTTFDDVPRLHDVDVVLGAARPSGTLRLLVRWESPETPRTVYLDVTDEMRSHVAGDGRKPCALDAAGAVEIPSVPAGRVKIAVAAEAQWSAESLDTLLVTTTPSADVEVGRTTEVVATLVTGGRVRATVKDADGKTIAPYSVILHSVEGDQIVGEFVRRRAEGGWTTSLDATPSVLEDAVAPGRYVVAARGRDGETGRREVIVIRGQTVDVEVSVKAAR